jgi:hypothetical protein
LRPSDVPIAHSSAAIGDRVGPAKSMSGGQRMRRWTLASRILAGALSFPLMLSANAASAASASIVYPIGAAHTSASTPNQRYINLHKAGEAEFYLNFVLPLDYVTNGLVRIVLYLTDGRPDSLSAPCTMRLEPYELIRSRPGRNILNDLSGLLGSQTTDIPTTKAVKKVFSLVPTAAFPGQRAGDGIEVGFKRLGSHVRDTCRRDVYLRHIEIQYPVQP